MKAVLMSIQPKWCELIASGKKTIEIRKTRPKLATPYKGYIYCTEQTRRKDAFNLPVSREEMLRDIPINGMKCMSKYANGTVWAEFICDSVVRHDLPYPAYQRETDRTLLKESCLTYTELHNYIGSGNRFYGLHFSELTIYEKPRELSEFYRPGFDEAFGEWEHYHIAGVPSGPEPNRSDWRVTRPPQSWCYVEELT